MVPHHLAHHWAQSWRPPWRASAAAPGVLWIASDVFSPCPNLLVSWFSAIILGTIIEWFFVDMAVIAIRNRIKATQKRIRTAKYQMGEKVVVKGVVVTPWLGGIASNAAKVVLRV